MIAVVPKTIVLLLLGGHGPTENWYLFRAPSRMVPDEVVQASLSCEPRTRPVCPEAAWLSIDETYESADGKRRIRPLAVSGAKFKRSNGTSVRHVGKDEWNQFRNSRRETLLLQLMFDALGPSSATVRLSSATFSSKGLFPNLCGEYHFQLTHEESGWTCSLR